MEALRMRGVFPARPACDGAEGCFRIIVQESHKSKGSSSRRGGGETTDHDHQRVLMQDSGLSAALYQVLAQTLGKVCVRGDGFFVLHMFNVCGTVTSS